MQFTHAFWIVSLALTTLAAPTPPPREAAGLTSQGFAIEPRGPTPAPPTMPQGNEENKGQNLKMFFGNEGKGPPVTAVGTENVNGKVTTPLPTSPSLQKLKQASDAAHEARRNPNSYYTFPEPDDHRTGKSS